ncbi:MAG: DUF1570 domain-containing protein [Planctomycetota bacterium]|mgnify:CR=1 FL=1
MNTTHKILLHWLALVTIACTTVHGQDFTDPINGSVQALQSNARGPAEGKNDAETGPRELPHDEKAEAIDLKKLGEGFNIVHAPHFTIFHNVPENEIQGFKAASEKTYSSSVKYMQSLGMTPQYPKAKLHTFYFSNQDQFKRCANLLEGDPGLSEGKYFLRANRSAFFNLKNRSGGLQSVEATQANINRLKEQLDKAKSQSERQSLQKQIAAEREKEKAAIAYGNDWNTVLLQHELAHQILFNFGFHTQLGCPTNPRWFVEGTALMLESTGNGKSSNIGAVNQLRLRDYRRQEKEGKLIDPKELICGENTFNNAATMNPAYNTAWALTHYLNRTKRTKIRVYADLIKKRTVDYRSTPEQEVETFEAAFGKLDDKWIQKWRDWMKQVR